MTVRITITPDAREALERIRAETRERLERMLGRRLETGPLEMGTKQPKLSRPFLRRTPAKAEAVE